MAGRPAPHGHLEFFEVPYSLIDTVSYGVSESGVPVPSPLLLVGPIGLVLLRGRRNR
jgi:hypothetical protein